MTQSTIIVRDVPPADLSATLQWLFPHVTIDRAQWMLGQLTERVERKRMAEIIAIDGVISGETVCAAIAVLQPARAASLLVIHTTGSHQLAEKSVFSRLQAHLRDRGVHFLQAGSDSLQQEKRLARLGFEHLARLAVLVLESETMANLDCTDDSRMQFHSVDSDETMMELICQTAERSFVETCDCPALSDFRTASEIVNGYRLAPQFDPTFWRLATLDGKAAGCLILTPHRANPMPSEGAGLVAIGAVEISYMGLDPKYRKRGLGRDLLIESVRIARRCDASRMVLAVDRENSPAIALYQRQGWAEVAEESVWGMRISPQFAG